MALSPAAYANQLTNIDALLYAQDMRDRDTIDSELRRLAAMRRSIGEHGGELSSRRVDELLDERLGHRAEASETESIEPWKSKLGAGTWSQCEETDDVIPYRRKGVLRRFGLLAALPLSLLAVAAMLAVMFAVHHPHPGAQPTAVPPSSAPPSPPPSGPPPSPAAPAPPPDIIDRAFIDTLKQQGVPVPGNEYVLSHAHAVCDFVAHQPNFEEAVGFVQQSSMWDATQSTEFAAGAIASYCPQYESASSGEMQQALQNILSDLHAIQGRLQDIRDDLQAIPGQR